MRLEIKVTFVVWILSQFLLGGLLFAADKKPAPDSGSSSFGVIAVVNGENVPEEEFLVALRKGVREKYYHGKVSEDEMKSFREEVANRLVTNIALAQKATQRGIKIDMAKVQEQLDGLDEKFSKEEGWSDYRAAVLPIFRKRLVNEELLKILEKQVREVSKPSGAEVKAYYAAFPDKFTVPEKWHVSLIMLKVDPSSSKDVWTAAVNEADDLVGRIRKGAKFEELARIHSGDESAINGGDMGYIHTGMLAKPAQDVLNLMSVGQVSEPVMLLQGVAIFRLDGIQKAKLNPLAKVADRAEALLLREQQEKAWELFVTKVRADAQVTLNKDVINGVVASKQEK